MAAAENETVPPTYRVGANGVVSWVIKGLVDMTVNGMIELVDEP